MSKSKFEKKQRAKHKRKEAIDKEVIAIKQHVYRPIHMIPVVRKPKQKG